MNNLLLKIGAVLIGAIILLLLIAKGFGVAIGIRTNANQFSEQLAGISALTLLVLVLLLAEIILAYLLLRPLTKR